MFVFVFVSAEGVQPEHLVKHDEINTLCMLDNHEGLNYSQLTKYSASKYYSDGQLIGLPQYVCVSASPFVYLCNNTNRL